MASPFLANELARGARRAAADRVAKRFDGRLAPDRLRRVVSLLANAHPERLRHAFVIQYADGKHRFLDIPSAIQMAGLRKLQRAGRVIWFESLEKLLQQVQGEMKES